MDIIRMNYSHSPHFMSELFSPPLLVCLLTFAAALLLWILLPEPGMPETCGWEGLALGPVTEEELWGICSTTSSCWLALCRSAPICGGGLMFTCYSSCCTLCSSACLCWSTACLSSILSTATHAPTLSLLIKPWLMRWLTWFSIRSWFWSYYWCCTNCSSISANLFSLISISIFSAASCNFASWISALVLLGLADSLKSWYILPLLVLTALLFW